MHDDIDLWTRDWPLTPTYYYYCEFHQEIIIAPIIYRCWCMGSREDVNEYIFFREPVFQHLLCSSTSTNACSCSQPKTLSAEWWNYHRYSVSYSTIESYSKVCHHGTYIQLTIDCPPTSLQEATGIWTLEQVIYGPTTYVRTSFILSLSKSLQWNLYLYPVSIKTTWLATTSL